jgi:glycerophosphoryl diester phosphodiesterase
MRFSQERNTMSIRLLAGLLLPVAMTTSAVAQTPFQFYEPVQLPRKVQVVANGGMRMLAPANSVEAIDECALDYVEWAAIDVRLTKDGRHVVMDEDPFRLSGDGKEYSAGRMTADELAKLDIGAAFAPRFKGVHVATLHEVLAAAKYRVNLVLNCHHVNVAELVKEIRDAQMEHQVVIAGSPDLRREVQQEAGKTIATVSPFNPKYSLEVLFASQSPAVIELAAQDVTPDICGVLHSFKLKVLANVVGAETDNPQTWEAMIHAGADLILTDDPAGVRACEVHKRVSEFPVQFACHRGANRYAPENTLPAIQSAVVLGADYIEIDIRTTQDGAFVLVHDGSLNRTTNGMGKVREHTAAAIAALDAGSWFGTPFAGLKVPTLDQGLTALGDSTHAYLDAKDIAPEALLAAIRKYDLMDRHVVYQSVDYGRRLKALDPNVRLLPPLRNGDELDAVAEVKPYGVDARWSILSKDLIDRCHAKGIKVFSDALGEHETVEEYRQAIGWGIDVIQTDHPLRVLRAIELESSPRH